MKIGKWEVSDSDLKAYETHLERRIYKLDDREVEVKEKERTKLHNKITQSIPENDQSEFLMTLQDYIDKKFEGTQYLIE